ncbi:MAG: patatin-like phospholipase family protein [Chloroflexota bacterium]
MPNKRKKIGLALSSGGIRGLAHVGVLAAFEKHGIPIDMIAGTSAGAIVGALYARTMDADETKRQTVDLVCRRLALLKDHDPTGSDLARGRKFEQWLKSAIGDVGFEELSIPFACVATDIATGEPVVIKEGSVVEAVRASTAFPLLVSAVKWQNRHLLDGGLVSPVPVSAARQLGADLVVAVDVVPDAGDMTDIETDRLESPDEPDPLFLMMRMFQIAGCQAVRTSLEGADVVIRPQLTHTGFSHHQIREFFLQGHLAAQRAIMELLRRMSATVVDKR